MEQAEDRVIEPSTMASLRLARDPFEAEAQTADDRERCMIVRRGRHANAMYAHLAESPPEDEPRCLRHGPIPGGLFPEPVAELDALVQVRESLETDDAKERARRSLTDREPTRASHIPVGRARVGVAVARLRVRIERDPR